MLHINPYHYNAPYQSLFKTVDSIISVWIITLVVNNKSSRLNKYFLENPFLNYIGKVSYGIYLYHYVYIVYVYPKACVFLQGFTVRHHRLGTLLQQRNINYWIHVSLIIAIAALSFELIETPLLRLKDYFNYSGKKGKTPNATLHSST